MNLNTELFRKTAPQTKLKLIAEATIAELGNVSQDTIVRCVKEAGSPTYSMKGKTKTSYKTLWCEYTSNGWDAGFRKVTISGRSHILNFEFEGVIDNQWTDSDGHYHDMNWRELKNLNSSIRKEVKYTDVYDRLHHHDFNWSYEKRMECIRTILRTYIENKYKDKLAQQ